MPSFQTIFCPGTKSLSIGRLADSKRESEDGTWLHKISGWFGISGAMIAIIDKRMSGGLEVAILGLCKFSLDYHALQTLISIQLMGAPGSRNSTG